MWIASALEKLQCSDSPTAAHLDPETFQSYKRMYSRMMLSCRYWHCARLNGIFNAEKDQRQHEETHTRSYKCLDCDFSVRGFSSQASLQNHREKYHVNNEDEAIPTKLASEEAPITQPVGERGSLKESTVNIEHLTKYADSLDADIEFMDMLKFNSMKIDVQKLSLGHIDIGDGTWGDLKHFAAKDSSALAEIRKIQLAE